MVDRHGVLGDPGRASLRTRRDDQIAGDREIAVPATLLNRSEHPYRGGIEIDEGQVAVDPGAQQTACVLTDVREPASCLTHGTQAADRRVESPDTRPSSVKREADEAVDAQRRGETVEGQSRRRDVCGTLG